MAAAAVLVCAAAACEDPVSVQPSVGVVHGTVVDGEGAGIAGVDLRIYLSDPEICEVRTPASADGAALTEADGRYAAEVKYLNVEEAVLCAVVVAVPPAGSGIRADTAPGQSLTVRHRSRVPPMDSARADLVLEWSSALREPSVSGAE
jgi:hypothetical protein